MYVYTYIHAHDVTLVVYRSSKSVKQLQPLHSDTDEDTLSTTHTTSRVDLKDLSSFDRASKKFLEEMKDTFLRLEREAKVNTHTRTQRRL